MSSFASAAPDDKDYDSDEPIGLPRKFTREHQYVSESSNRLQLYGLNKSFIHKFVLSHTVDADNIELMMNRKKSTSLQMFVSATKYHFDKYYDVNVTSILKKMIRLMTDNLSSYTDFDRYITNNNFCLIYLFNIVENFNDVLDFIGVVYSIYLGCDNVPDGGYPESTYIDFIKGNGIPCSNSVTPNQYISYLLSNGSLKGENLDKLDEIIISINKFVGNYLVDNIQDITQTFNNDIVQVIIDFMDKFDDILMQNNVIDFDSSHLKIKIIVLLSYFNATPKV